MILAQVEQQKIMADIQNKQAELELKRQAMLLEDDRARDKQEADSGAPRGIVLLVEFGNANFVKIKRHDAKRCD
jgi:hypothetical protein